MGALQTGPQGKWRSSSSSSSAPAASAWNARKESRKEVFPRSCASLFQTSQAPGGCRWCHDRNLSPQQTLPVTRLVPAVHFRRCIRDAGGSAFFLFFMGGGAICRRIGGCQPRLLPSHRLSPQRGLKLAGGPSS